MITGITSLTPRVRRLIVLKFVFLTIGAFFWTARHGLVPRYASAMMRYGSGQVDVIGQLGLRCGTLALSTGLFRLIQESGVNAVLVLLALERANEIDFNIADESGCFPFNFENSFV